MGTRVPVPDRVPDCKATLGFPLGALSNLVGHAKGVEGARALGGFVFWLPYGHEMQGSPFTR